ncbi:archaeal heat shock protein Hsp14 [Sulfuracidifex metallicus]|uniref:archaeal heat shock protein Hsp14 n=1 Tax=Sulfuracidifex metallicus TaxID=47303 RepID=UPI0022755113|nr:archaeal heat shock protein Hsp14 [Sulfuracidifex metallicus]MCY0849459.1 Hsp20/alpha crystallin family protein [Sulfuracidifex metallicus]
MDMMETVKKEISKRLEELSKEFYENVIPPLDIYENEGFLYITADLPGFSKDSIKVRLLGENYLEIIAERESKIEGTKYISQRPTRIDRKVRLPLKIKSDQQIAAKYENGVLTIKAPVQSGGVTIKIE